MQGHPTGPDREEAPDRASSSQRVAAVLALLAPSAMVVIAAVALAGDVAIAALAVGLVLAASVAIWFALTTRGVPRVLSSLLGGLAAAGLVVVLATHWQGALVLAALLLLLAAFGLAARYALGRTGAPAARTVAARTVAAGAAARARPDHQPVVGRREGGALRPRR